MPKLHTWTDSEIAYLDQNYRKLGCTQVAKYLNICKSLVYAKAQTRGLVKSWSERPTLIGPKEIPERIKANLGFYEIPYDSAIFK